MVALVNLAAQPLMSGPNKYDLGLLFRAALKGYMKRMLSHT